MHARIVLAALAIIATWCASAILLDAWATSGDAWLDRGRVWPYRHAHLIEQYSLGRFEPVRDSMFVVSAAIRNIIPFFLGVVVASAGLPRCASTVLLSVLLGAFVLHLIAFRWSVPLMKEAYAMEWAFAAIGALLGWIAARSRRARTVV